MVNRFSTTSIDADMVSAPPQFAVERVTPVTLPHRLECEVRRELLSQPHLRFSSLVVRRLENGVCLQGVLEADDNAPDVVSIAQRVAGVDQVLNHLLVSGCSEVPRKG